MKWLVKTVTDDGRPTTETVEAERFSVAQGFAIFFDTTEKTEKDGEHVMRAAFPPNTWTRVMEVGDV